tara:strand:- start:38653 stop:39333 length:681 start_codon:yes stop_codon:yes gene_type:complete
MQLNNVTLVCIDDIYTYEASLLLKHLNSQIKFADVKLFHSKEKKYTYSVNTKPINTIQKYNSLLLHDIDRHINTSHMMVVQLDGFFFEAKNWDKEFLEYDYIGAPLRHGNSIVVGNGGFSIRSKELVMKTKEVIKEKGINYKNIKLEDWFVSIEIRQELLNKGIKFAPKEIAFKFSTHGMMPLRDDSFGFHGKETFTFNNEVSSPAVKKIKLFHPRMTSKKLGLIS